MAWGSPTIAGAVALAVTLGLFVAVSSRYVRARLRFSIGLLLAFLLLEVAVTQGFGDVELMSALARLVFVLAVINLGISILANPWRANRPSERFPAIVQDVTLIGLFTVVATVLMKEQLLTTSAVGAVVVGFALQDTLGNLFSGLAIQIEKPFRVGHWIAVGDREGQVQEITWRATKLLTKAGQFLVVPNGIISKEAILNYSEPTVPTRLMVEVGVSYSTPPNQAKAAVNEALSQSPIVLVSPPVAVMLHDFGASAMTYHVWFWIADYAQELEARDQVRTNIWYTFRRKNIEIPYPIQVEYSRDEMPQRSEGDVMTSAAQLGAIDLFSTLPLESRLALSRTGQEHIFAAGEAIVRQGDTGHSMYVLLSGSARVVIEPAGAEVARLAPGGFFGEMSMLTGDPRTATVRLGRCAGAGNVGGPLSRSGAGAAGAGRAHQHRGLSASGRTRRSACGGRRDRSGDDGAANAVSTNSGVFAFAVTSGESPRSLRHRLAFTRKR
ncbi:MAG: mechanosensitive ion channel [Acidobacteria bacterium]|nr:mechanosensitive ion channel [Acidobacteriota bacterium]